jgi:hypothetical protein
MARFVTNRCHTPLSAARHLLRPTVFGQSVGGPTRSSTTRRGKAPRLNVLYIPFREATPSRLPLLLSHHIGDSPRRSEIVDGTSDINCQQHDRLRNRLSHVSVWLYSSKPNLHLCIRIQHSVLGQEDSHAPDPPAMGVVGTTETTMVNAPYTPIVSEREFFVNRRSYHIIAAIREKL